MSLATRCPACSTVFRVVQDQLRVSEGWVRCGQCQEVFNALETLFDLDTEPAALPPAPPRPPQAPAGRAPAAVARPSSPSLPAAPPPPPQPAPVPTSTPVASAPAADDIAEWDDHPHPADEWDPDQATLPMSLEALAASYRASQASGHTDLRNIAPAPVAPSPAATTAPASPSVPDDVITVAMPLAQDESEEEQAPTPSRFMGPLPDWARTPSPRERRKKSRRAAADGHAQPHQSAGSTRRRRKKPEFVRQAERAAQWRRPMVRLVLGLAATTLGAMLASQAAYHYRDTLAAKVPALSPALHAGCDWVGCRIAAPRALERIRLDASDLTRTEQEQVLRFVADLHNTAEHPVRAPALDLSFTNAAGEVVSRRVLLPGELNAPRDDAIPAEGQWRVDALLAVGELRVAGYTVEVFYP